MDNNDENIDLQFVDNLLAKVTPEMQARIDFKMNLAAKIYAGMKAKGWNQKEFAEVMKKPGSLISRWMSGTNNFEADTLFEIQNVLEISLIDTAIYVAKTKVVYERVNVQMTISAESFRNIDMPDNPLFQRLDKGIRNITVSSDSERNISCEILCTEN